MHLPSHGVEVGPILRLDDSAAVDPVVDGIEVDLGRHMSQEIGNRLRMPPSTSHLEEGQMSAEGCGEANRVGVCLEFLVWDGTRHGDLQIVTTTFI